MREVLIPVGLSALFVATLIGGGMFLDSRAKPPHDPKPYPAEIRVLVGTGCEGPSDIAVAWEEDMLPRCDRIEAHVVSNETISEGG